MVTHMRAIRRRMSVLGLSQHAFAAMLGISQPTLNARLNGYRRPPAGFEKQASETLDVLEEAERAAADARAKVLERGAIRVGERPAPMRRTRDGAAAARQ